MPLAMAGALALLTGAAASVQVAPSAAPAAPLEREIVVVGQRGQDQRIRTFVDALALPSAKDQLGRAEDGICPRSFGFSEADNRAFAQRMRRLAQAAGVPTAAQDCRPNVLVLVVADKKAAIEHWRIKRPDFFDGLEQRQIRALANGEGPVAAWQIVHVKGEGRRSIGRDTSGINDHYLLSEVWPSRLGKRIQLEFFASFVVIEASALGNADLVQLADYAAMRTFANTDPAAAAAQPVPTILWLFDDTLEEEAPLSVSHWDLAFLKGLYATKPAASAAQQQRAVAREVLDDLGRDPERTAKD
ncbi:MAG TPA: hypothetical protein VF582_02060 [Allosphingosinicella sp.]|jgi:hypothetical protein